MMLIFSPIARLQLKTFCRKDFKRFKYKKKWAMTLKPKSHSQSALEHFDTYYKPVYGNLWPSIRIALLSQQKYCALVNNFSHQEEICEKLQHLGAKNIITNAVKTKAKITNRGNKMDPEGMDMSLENVNWHNNRSSNQNNLQNLNNCRSELIDPLSLNPDTNLEEFMPVEKVYSQSEMLKREEIQQSVYEPRDVQIDTVPPSECVLPEELRVFAFDRGDVSDFPAPKPDDAGLLGYYLLDAASLLPVVALDLQPHDNVLDLCAAPGGKTLAILQLLSAERVTCNDASQGRLRRLKEILQWYYPFRSDVTIFQRDGRRMSEALYTKVLVDVPCNSDRHMVLENDNNLFKPGRLKERLELPTRQKDLLIAAIKSCKPGGSIVYSTCTLSPAQNDGVVQAAMEEIWQETPIDVVIHDLRWLASKFRNTFRFYDKCRHGQLVLPCLTTNFGPMYFSKITRMK